MFIKSKIKYDKNDNLESSKKPRKYGFCKQLIVNRVPAIRIDPDQNKEKKALVLSIFFFFLEIYFFGCTSEYGIVTISLKLYINRFSLSSLQVFSDHDTKHLCIEIELLHDELARLKSIVTDQDKLIAQLEDRLMQLTAALDQHSTRRSFNSNLFVFSTILHALARLSGQKRSQINEFEMFGLLSLESACQFQVVVINYDKTKCLSRLVRVIYRRLLAAPVSYQSLTRAQSSCRALIALSRSCSTTSPNGPSRSLSLSLNPMHPLLFLFVDCAMRSISPSTPNLHQCRSRKREHSRRLRNCCNYYRRTNQSLNSTMRGSNSTRVLCV